MSKRNRFQSTDTTILPLPGDDDKWIKVKTRLNTGDQKRLESAGVKPVVMEGRIFQIVDWGLHDIERAAVFIVDWNLDDADGKNIKFSLDALKALEPETFEDINKAVMDHAVKQAELKKLEREAEKKTITDLPPAAEPNEEPLSQ